MKRILITSLLLLTGCGFRTIDAGDVGIETEFGKVVGDVIEPGLFTYNPFIKSVHEMNCRTQVLNGKNETYTKDIQQSNIDYTVNFNLNRQFAQKMYSEVGVDWNDVLLPQVINATIKNTVGQWNAVDLISNREAVIDEIQKELVIALEPRGITVSKFEITNVSFTAEFEKAVEAKVVAVQQAAQAVNHTKQIQEEANQKVITATAEAESMKIRSAALSQNANLVQYEAVMHWDGKLPVYMTGSVPFINIGNK